MAKKKVIIEQEIDEEDVQSGKFVAIVSGQGMKRRADGRIDTVDYREAFVLDSTTAPLSEIISHYLKPRLIKKYGKDITGLYTHKLETVFPEHDPESIEGLTIDIMSMDQLVKYCKSKGLKGFDPADFSDVLEARETCRAALESEALYVQTREFYKAKTKRQKYRQAVLERTDEDEILAKYDAGKTVKKPKTAEEPEEFQVV